MKFYIVHFNTPNLTDCCCKSILKYHENAEIVIFDNSDKLPFKTELQTIQILNNTSGELLNIEVELANFIQRNKITANTIIEEKTVKSNFGSFKHSISIQWIFEHETEPFILLDSDVLLKKQCNDLKTDYGFSADLESFDSRIWPFIVYFNTPLLKQNNINFLKNDIICPAKPVDTGYYFLQNCLRNRIKFNMINYNDYVVHFGNGSWKENGNAWISHFQTEQLNENEWLKRYKELYEHY